MTAQKKKANDAWEKFLNPTTLKQSLIEASVFLTAYEMFKQSATEKLLSFFSDGITKEGGFSESPEYKKEVIALHPRDRFHASCIWFQQTGVISQDDLDKINDIRCHRNAIAHEMIDFISDAGSSIDANLIAKLFTILRKIDTWWITEIEMPSNPNFDDQSSDSIRSDQIQSGNMILMQRILSLFFGDESSISELHNQLRGHSRSRSS